MSNFISAHHCEELFISSSVYFDLIWTLIFALGFQHLPRDLANVNEWKIMFDPYISTLSNPKWRPPVSENYQ